jgi:peptidoglycan/LPS O-acetylase OafA/YrhL
MQGILRSSMPRTDLMTSHRDTQLDAARGLAMLLVLYGHLLQPVFYGPSGFAQGPSFTVWRVIYAFHMPFFFLLCGVVDRIRGFADLGESSLSALKLVLTALAFSFLALIPQTLNGSRSLASALLDNLCGDGLGLGVLWFLIVLALLRVIYAAALATASACGYWLLLAGVLALSWTCCAHASRFWQLQALFGTLPFYVAGRRVGRGVFDLSAAVGLCGLALLLLCAPTNFAHIATGQYGDPVLFAGAAVAGCGFMLTLAGHLRGLPCRIAAVTGRMSFDLYIVSGVVLLVLPRRPDWDSWACLVLLAIVGLPLHAMAALALRGPIRSVRAAVGYVVDGLVGKWRLRAASDASE